MAPFDRPYTTFYWSAMAVFQWGPLTVGKITIFDHEASHGLSASEELLVDIRAKKCDCVE